MLKRNAAMNVSAGTGMKILGAKILGTVSLAVLLAGCGSMGSGNFSPAAVFFAGSTPPDATPPAEVEFECPAAEIREGGAALRVGGNGESLRAQFAITDTARECRVEGRSIRISVGVEGRVMLGTAGSPGTFSAPMRVVMKRGDKVVATKTERLSVVVPQGDTLGSFDSVQKDFVVPLDGPELTITVGFDSGGGEVSVSKKR